MYVGPPLENLILHDSWSASLMEWKRYMLLCFCLYTFTHIVLQYAIHEIRNDSFSLLNKQTHSHSHICMLHFFRKYVVKIGPRQTYVHRCYHVVECHNHSPTSTDAVHKVDIKRDGEAATHPGVINTAIGYRVNGVCPAMMEYDDQQQYYWQLNKNKRRLKSKLEMIRGL